MIVANGLFHAVPTEPPDSVGIRAVRDTEIEISWAPVNCLHRNAEILGYMVQYGPTSTYEEMKSSSGMIVDFSFAMRNLQPNTSYSFQVYPVIRQQLPGSMLMTRLVSVVTEVSTSYTALA